METNKLTGIERAAMEIDLAVAHAYGVNAGQWRDRLHKILDHHCLGREAYNIHVESFVKYVASINEEIGRLRHRLFVQAETIQKYQSNPEHNGEQLSLEERHANQMKTILILQSQLQVLKQACAPILKWSDERPSIVKNIVAACKQIQ